jgi:MFS transporter, FHS family, glucose/mannose:H+ symporter
MLLFGISMVTLGSIAVHLRAKFQLDDIAFGTLFSILPLGILTGSLLFGPIADKFGYRILLSISLILMFIGFEGAAFAQSTGVLKICILLFGLGGGVVNGSTNALVADISDRDKMANLSLLGVFYGIGALGMPLISGILEDHFSFEAILSTFGIITLGTGFLFFMIKFPPPKQTERYEFRKGFILIRDSALILISFFLFLQSGFEAIINNWTTTFLIKQHAVEPGNALFALSLFVAGMTLMRLLSGSIFRSVAVRKIMFSSFGMILVGLLLLKTGISFSLSSAGLMLLGAGLASGFPIMLGFVGARFNELSGTAFSLVLFIALLGNTLVNFGMGIIAQKFGVNHLINFAFVETIIMIVLSLFIFTKINTHIKNQ